MDIRKLQRAIVDGLEDVKAQDIVVFNTEALSPLFERVIIASGTSNRQTKALAASVRDSVRKNGLQVLRTEGEENGEWIIVDCGAAVAHIMQPAIREYYHLEELWGTKPVKLKAAPVRGLVKAEEPTKAARAPRATASAAAAPTRTAKPATATAAPGRSARPAKAPAPTASPGRSRSKPRAPEPVFAPVHPSYKAPPQMPAPATAKPKAVGRAPVRRAGPVAPSKGTAVRSSGTIKKAAPLKSVANKAVAKKVGKTWVGTPAVTKAAAPKTGTPRAANPHTPAPKRKVAASKRAAAPSFTGGAPRKSAPGGKAPRGGKTPR
jgi:ribosome-associated protein